MGAAHAGIQVRWARATVSLRLWAYRPTLPTASPSLVRARVPSRNAAEMPGVERDYGRKDGCLRAESVHRWSNCVLVLSQDEIRPNKLSMPSPPHGPQRPLESPLDCRGQTLSAGEPVWPRGGVGVCHGPCGR